MTRPQRTPGAEPSTGELPEDTAVAVSPHTLASQTALDVLAAGGNAVDAAVAMNAVLGVVLPDTCGPGGDLFALVHVPGEDTPLALNSSGRAGSGADAATLRAAGHTSMPVQTHHAVTVPGCVDGWTTLIERLGNLDLDAVLEPAIRIASEGFAVSPELHRSLARYHDRIGDQPAAAELYPEGAPPDPGTGLERPQMAATLRTLAGGGRAAFFSGPVGRGIMAATRGLITSDDLATNQSTWIDPVGLDLFDRRGWTIPPNSQGYQTLATLWIFEQLDPPSDPNDPAYQHALIEAYRAVAHERADVVSDQATAPLPPEELVSPERLGERLALLSDNRRASWPAAGAAPGGTAYMCVLDAAGVGVSLIQSNFWGIGSGLSAGATGVWLQNRGGGFDLRQGHPNELTPGRRPLHTLVPTIWTRGGALDLILGTRGGDHQPQLLAQLAAHHFHGSLGTDDSQSLPRWSIDQFGSEEPPVVVEARFAPNTLRGLEQRGHIVNPVDPWQPGWGPVSAIDASGPIKGSADPRVSTSAALSA